MRQTSLNWNLLLLLTLVGCGGSGDAESGETPAPPAAPSLSPEEQDQQLGAKLNPYIDLINQVSRSLGDAERRYAVFVARHEVDGVLQAPESSTHAFTSSPSSPASYVRAAQRAAEQEPDLPALEQTLPAYSAAAEAVVARVPEVVAYYRSRLFEADDMARGHELHGLLLAEFGAFRSASDALRAALDVQQRGLRDRGIERLGAQPNERTAFLLETALAAAEDALGTMSDAHFSEAGQVEGVDPAALTAATARLTAANGPAVSHVVEHTADVGTHAMALTRELREFAGDLEALQAHLNQGAWSADEMRSISTGQAALVSGTPDSVVASYNQVVRAGNDWRRHRP